MVKKLKSVNRLCEIIQVKESDIGRLLCRKSKYYYPFIINYKDGKQRAINAPKGKLKLIQSRIYERILKPHIKNLPKNIAGSRVGSDNIKNAKIHQYSRAILKYDIENFFPSISIEKVFYVFRYKLGFCKKAAVILSEICTYENYLPQGSPVSASIGIVVTEKMALELKFFCENNGVNFSIYVDDITVSSKNFQTLLSNKKKIDYIISKSKLKLNRKKSGKIIKKGQKGFAITGVSIGLDNQLYIGKSKSKKLNSLKMLKRKSGYKGLMSYKNRVRKLSKPIEMF